MSRTEYLISAVVVSTAVTWTLRALPFTAVAPLRASRTIQYLGACMPAGVMVILLAYCLRNVRAADAGGLAPFIALAATIGLHVWRRNAVLSITVGTLVQVVLSSAVLVR